MIERTAAIPRVRRLLSEAETCLSKWDDMQRKQPMRLIIERAISALREHVNDDQVTRREQNSAVYRALTDSISTEESDAGQLVLQATEIYSKYA